MLQAVADAPGKQSLCQGFHFCQGGSARFIQVHTSHEVWYTCLTFCSERGPPPPGATVAMRLAGEEEHRKPLYRDRVPYVIARGEPGTILNERAFAPQELLENG
jgi:hypothetical protein